MSILRQRYAIQLNCMGSGIFLLIALLYSLLCQFFLETSQNGILEPSSVKLIGTTDKLFRQKVVYSFYIV